MPEQQPLIQGRGVTKRFGTFTAVDGIDICVEAGECFGFLGPNGAGKTSTMRMIACVSPPTDGTLTVLDMDVTTHGRDIRARLGVVPQEDTLDIEMSVRENLVVYGRYFGLPRAVLAERADELLDFARLTERADERVDPLSGGMKRRLTIARALVNDPDVVLLDEPTTGLDPQARHLLWDRLHGLKQRGVTLVLTTHYMDEAEQLCDRLVIMDGGRIAAEGSPRQLIDRHASREVVELRVPDDARRSALADDARQTGERVEVVAERIIVYAAHGDAVLAALAHHGLPSTSVLVRRASLEDVFLLLTGRSLEDG